MRSHTWTLKADTRGAEIQRARWAGRLNLVRWHLPCVGPGCGTRFMPLTWRLKFWGGSYIYGKFVYLWCRLLAKGVLNWKLWGTQPRSQAVWTINAFLCHRLQDTIFCVYHRQHTLSSTHCMQCTFYAHNAVPVSLQMYLQTRGLHVV